MWLAGSLLAGCTTLEVVGFDDLSVRSRGLWVRATDERGQLEEFHTYWITNDPDLDCDNVGRVFSPGQYEESDELETLHQAIYDATGEEARCRAELAYYEALDRHRGPRTDRLFVAVLFFPELEDPKLAFNAGLPPVGESLGRSSGGFLPDARWGGSWQSAWDQARWYLDNVDCEDAAQRDTRSVPPPEEESGGMRGVVTFEEAGAGYTGDLAVGFESGKGALVGSLEGRVRFEPCDYVQPSYNN